jgi:small-conductance mechanosensitive channel
MFEAWKASFVESLTHSWDGVAGLLPGLMGAMLALLGGLIIALAARRLIILAARRLGLNRFSRKAGLEDLLSNAGIKSTAAEIVANVLFWAILLSALVSAAEAVGLESLSETIQSLVLYLPRLVASLLLLVMGLMLASFARKFITRHFERMGILHSRSIAGAVYGLLVLVAGTMAVSQLEIETDLFKQVIVIVLVTVGISVALTVGLGTREITKNLLAGVYARDLFMPGNQIQLKDHRGKLRKVGTVTTEIEVSDERIVYIPNSSLLESSVSVDGKEEWP